MSQNAPFMRPVVEKLEASRIREVANEGLGRDNVLKFWFGESDEVSCSRAKPSTRTTSACPNCAKRSPTTPMACIPGAVQPTGWTGWPSPRAV